MDLKKKIIFCDWLDELNHYSIPHNFLVKIKKLCSIYNHEFIVDQSSNVINYKKNIVVYIGNKPNSNLIKYSSLKWIHFGSVGVDKINLKTAQKKKIIITNASGIFDKSVATLIFSLIIQSLCPKIIKPKDFNRIFWENNSTKLDEIYVNILGHGGISQYLINFLLLSELKFKVFTRNPNNYLSFEYETHKFSEISNIATIQNNSIIVNLLPANKNTKNLVNEKFLNNYQRILTYLNYGRLSTEKTQDVIKALTKNKIEKAFWDVIRDPNEMKVMKNVFGDRVFFTPHSSSFLYNHWTLSMDLLFFNLKKYFSGDLQDMKNIVHE